MGFILLGGEMYIKSELVDNILSWCEIYFFIYEVAVWEMGFYPIGLVLRNIGKDLRKTQVEYVTTKFFSNMQRFWSLKRGTKIVNFENEI